MQLCVPSSRFTLAGFGLAATLSVSPLVCADSGLLDAHTLIVDPSLPKAQREAMLLAARRSAFSRALHRDLRGTQRAWSACRLSGKRYLSD